MIWLVPQNLSLRQFKYNFLGYSGGGEKGRNQVLSPIWIAQTKRMRALAMKISSHESSSRSYVCQPRSLGSLSSFLEKVLFFFSNILPLDRSVSTFDKILVKDPPSVRIWSVSMDTWPVAARVHFLDEGRERTLETTSTWCRGCD